MSFIMGEGPDVLILEGWAAPSQVYEIIGKKLSHKYRVLCPDMPGVGDCPEPAAPMTVGDYADFIERYAREQSLSDCVIICHSNGARTAAELFSRKTLSCKKLIIVGGAGVPKKKNLLFSLRLFGYKCLKLLGRLPLFRPIYEKERQKRSSEDYKNASPVMRKTLVNLINSDMREKLSEISAPTLLIWGENDTATPLYMGEKMEKIVKNSGLAVIKNAGHYSFLDNWPQFSAVLDAFI